MRSREKFELTEFESRLGHVLVEMGRLTREQLRRAIDLHNKSPITLRFGMFLVALGYVSHNDVKLALDAQQGLRSHSRHKRALAKASIAGDSSRHIQQRARSIRGKMAEVKRITGQEYAAITDEMLKGRGSAT